MNKERIIASLKVIWPTVYRIINDGLYWLVTIVKSGIRIAIEQIKGTFNG